MSHFSMLMIVPKELNTSPHSLDDTIKSYMSDKLAPYDENIEMPEYKKDLVSDEDKKSFTKTYTEFKKDRSYGVKSKKEEEENSKLSFEDLYKRYGRDWNGKCWKKKSKGEWWNYSTYNPKSQWDWWRVGGRWDGDITDNKDKVTDDDKGGFNFEDRFETISNNSLTVKDYLKKLKKDFDKYHTYGIINKAGEWLSEGEMGWWGVSVNDKEPKEFETLFIEELNNAEKDDLVVCFDCHI